MGISFRTSLTVLLSITAMLTSPTAAVPVECEDLRSIISFCNCEAGVVNGVEINSRVVINCRNLNLSSVPPIQGSSSHIIYEMTLRQNNIQDIPAGAFSGLNIQRLDVRDNRLRTFDANAFQDLQDELQELYLGAEARANIQTPLYALINLTSLRVLHLEYFTFPLDEITPGILNRLTSLEELTLEYNNVVYIDSGAFPPQLTSLSLNHQNISSLPLDAIRSMTMLESLTIHNTKISTISNSVFQLNTQLSHLDLGYNQIGQLNSNCFLGVTGSLRTLSLRNNPIPRVTDLDEIQTLTALTSLRLSEITLSSLPAGARFLINKDNLESLYLDGNTLSALTARVFNLPRLSHLDLSSNTLTTLEDPVFTELASLEYLDLSQQTSAQTLTLPTSLTFLSSLQTLKLNHVRLSKTTLWQRITPISTLQKLYLEGASLTSIPDYSFVNHTQLTELHLNGNNFTNLTQEMLAGLRGLRKLTMNNNNIEAISSCVFHGFDLSPALSLELIGNNLHCDCRLRWLLEEVQAQRLQLTGFETCSSPLDKASDPLNTFQPTDFTCVSTTEDPTCLELYTTPQPPIITTQPAPEFTLTITNVTATSIRIIWAVANTQGINHFKVQYNDLSEGTSSFSIQLATTQRSYTVENLQAATTYTMCVFAYDSSSVTLALKCTQPTETEGGTSGLSEENNGSSNTGIIVGVVVGIVILLAIVIAIIVLFLRKRSSSKELPAQPHVFTSSELPSMTPSSRQFTRPAQKQQPKVGRALDDHIKVTVISDGHTSPTTTGERQSVGSYQFLNEKHPNPNPQIVPKDYSNYSNEMDSRPLPTAPEGSMGGYYNSKGQIQQGKSTNFYDQINQYQ